MIVTMPDDYPQWSQRLRDLAKETDVSPSLIYVGFEVVEGFLNSDEKDKRYWRGQILKKYVAEIMDIYFKGQALLKASEGAEVYTPGYKPIDILPIKEALIEELSKFPEGGEEKAREYAFTRALVEISQFLDKKGKYLFDYVLEDLKDDIETFYKVELFFKMAEGSN